MSIEITPGSIAIYLLTVLIELAVIFLIKYLIEKLPHGRTIIYCVGIFFTFILMAFYIFGAYTSIPNWQAVTVYLLIAIGLIISLYFLYKGKHIPILIFLGICVLGSLIYEIISKRYFSTNIPNFLFIMALFVHKKSH